MNIVRSDESVADIIGAAEFIAQDNEDAAIRFIDAIDAAFDLIARSPGIGVRRKLRSLPKIQMWVLNEYPAYLIFYKTDQDQVTVLRVIHSSRDYLRIFKK